jgi:hypothetical protein
MIKDRKKEKNTACRLIIQKKETHTLVDGEESNGTSISGILSLKLSFKSPHSAMTQCMNMSILFNHRSYVFTRACIFFVKATSTISTNKIARGGAGLYVFVRPKIRLRLFARPAVPLD